MSRSMVAWAVLLAASVAAYPAAASPAPPKLTVDKTFGKVAGWSIGYSDSLGGCLAAASYGDGTTLWFGFGGVRGSSYLALTNPKWRSLEVGGQYDLQMLAGHEKWRGTFTGFERGEARGLFQSGLKERFVADLSDAGTISVIFPGRPIPGPKAPYGYVWAERGHLLTNNHVVESCSDFSVRQPGRPSRPARLVARDATNDLAVLATDTPQKAVPPLSVRARLGENVYVYGYPQSDVLASTGNFTIGNVTATAGSNDDTRKIQISAPVHQGNSGGPALDQYGNVIGVVQSKQVAFASGDVPQNVNFAIKSTIALNFLEANGVEAPINVRTTDPLDGAGIAEKARDFTVQIVCQ